MNDVLKSRREELFEQYGRPKRLTGRGDILRILGLRDAIHPNDVAAMLYPSVECAEAFKALNGENHPDINVIGPFPVPGGAVSVLDLRGSLGRLVPMDPTRPDDATSRAPVDHGKTCRDEYFDEEAPNGHVAVRCPHYVDVLRYEDPARWVAP